ncbi:hypothetical protein [Sphingomonas oligophenolica]|uniref:Uncharacterized protein n=1 Tax=Sphingomonas oligophenolica TaxID=301154 RepID=A0A502CIR6_9SPHN|nr:hypothetical protein [Sphingomonas oligophenolica]TPG12622.1 hypothetical protein EAH84_07480 [Sphingomonas oligophenolica]
MKLDAFTGAGRRLARALRLSAVTAGLDALVLSATEQPWASATYIGARHRIELGLPAGPARYRWLAGLAEAELPMRGHIALPPAILAADDDRVTLEIVTLESH